MRAGEGRGARREIRDVSSSRGTPCERGQIARRRRSHRTDDPFGVVQSRLATHFSRWNDKHDPSVGVGYRREPIGQGTKMRTMPSPERRHDDRRRAAGGIETHGGHGIVPQAGAAVEAADEIVGSQADRTEGLSERGNLAAETTCVPIAAPPPPIEGAGADRMNRIGAGQGGHGELRSRPSERRPTSDDDRAVPTHLRRCVRWVCAYLRTKEQASADLTEPVLRPIFGVSEVTRDPPALEGRFAELDRPRRIMPGFDDYNAQFEQSIKRKLRRAERTACACRADAAGLDSGRSRGAGGTGQTHHRGHRSRRRHAARHDLDGDRPSFQRCRRRVRTWWGRSPQDRRCDPGDGGCTTTSGSREG